MAIETQNINNPLNTHQHNVDVNSLKESLRAYGEGSEGKKEETRELKIEEVIHQLVSANLPVADMEAMLSILPLDKRFAIENMILDEKRHQISTLSPEQYKQYLQVQFPNGVPADIGEIVLPTIKGAFEGYQLVGKKINETNVGENASEVTKRELQDAKREATGAAQTSEIATKQLSDDLSHAMV